MQLEVGGRGWGGDVSDLPTKSFLGIKFILEPISSKEKAKKFDPGTLQAKIQDGIRF